jgi:hypothetical protein
MIMSGGHFEYQQYRIEDIARGIEELIASNDDESLNEWGDRHGYGYSPETIEKFKLAVDSLRIAATMAQRIDWLVCGDDGEENFHRRWDEELKKNER